MTNRRIVLTDIDMVLAHSEWRANLITSSGWDEFHSRCEEDEPITDMVALMKSLAISGCYLIGVTGRPERFRKPTIKWLADHGCELHEVLFRPNDDFGKAEEVKERLTHKLFDRVLLAFDDDERVVEMYRRNGVTALLVSGRKVG